MSTFDPGYQIDAAQVVEAAAESILVTTVELDPPGPRIIYVNPAFERMTGWQRSEILGKTPRILQGPETDRSLLKALRSQLEAGHAWEGRAVNYRRDGTPFVMEWSVVPLRNADGKVYQYLAVQRDVTARVEADRARANLSRYFSPHLVRLLAERDEPLGPVRRQHACVLFIDIVGFSRMAETVVPEQLIYLLRSFHERMERLVFEHDGAILGYIGDAIMATFGIPAPSERDTIKALSCARAMLDEVAIWNEKRQTSGSFAVPVGIGLHCGSVVVGDVGSKRTMAFTVIGDTVNVASRLEQLTRALDCALVVSDDLIRRVRDSAEASEAHALLSGFSDKGEYEIRGRSRPVRVWTLVGRTDFI